ncbi:MAG: PAS domain S-box protein, partial [Chloroflexota bacterium]
MVKKDFDKGPEERNSPATVTTSAWFRAVYEQSPVCIELYDSEGHLLDANPACLALFGVEDKSELRGFSLFDDPNLPDEQKERLRVGEQAEYEHQFDFGLVREQGLYRTTRSGIAHLHVEIVPLQVHGNTVGGYVVQVEDITEQRAWADALERSRERFRTLFENAPDAFYVMDLEGRFLDANSAAEEMTGRTRTELAGMSFGDAGILAATELPRAMGLLMRSRQGEETGPDELEMLRSDGTRLTAEVRTLPIELEDRPVVLGIARDVTRRKQVEEDLRESEERFRAVFEESLDAIYIGRLDGSIVDVNDAWLEMFGYSRDEIATLNAADMYAEPGVRDDFLRRTVEHGRVADVVRYRKKDGTPFECQRILVARRNQSGAVVGVQGVNRDVTAQLQAERALQESEEKFRALFEQSLDAIYINSPDGRHIDVNQAWLDMFGYSREDLETFRPVDLYANPADRQAFLQRIEASKYVDDEVWFKRKDGTPVLCHRMVVARRDENGRIVVFQGVMRDVTEQRRGEEALRRSEEEYRRLFEQSRDAIYLIAADGRITNANGTATEMFGYTRQELLSMNVQSLYAEPSIRTDVIREALERGGLQDYELAFKRKDGDIRECVVTTTVLRDAGGDFVGFQTVIRDVTGQKRAERRVREYAQRLDTAMSAGNLAWWQMELPSGRVEFDERKATVLGRKPAEFQHYRDFTDLLHPDDYESAMHAMRQHLEGLAAKYEVEYRIRKADGDYVWFRDVGSVTSWHPDGSPAVVTGIVVDITALKTTEQRLEESNRELQRVAASIDIAREEERASVAWELHDEVAQALSAIKMDLHACSGNLPPDVLSRVEPTIKEVLALLDDTIERLRRLYTNLVPFMLEDLGLVAALEWYLQSFHEETGIQTR